MEFNKKKATTYKTKNEDKIQDSDDIEEKKEYTPTIRYSDKDKELNDNEDGYKPKILPSRFWNENKEEEDNEQ